MIQRKTKAHLSMAKDAEIAENRHGVAQRKSVEPVDHWAFLDEIEAPMWVDLDLEARSGYKDNDNDWFQISHLFHQCSSLQLISAFSHLGEENANRDFSIEGPYSPKLPPSVSRSRGKHYRSREWGQSNCEVTSNKWDPVKNLSSKSPLLNSKSSLVNLGSGEKIKPKPSNGNKKGSDRSKANSGCESTLTETSGPNYTKPSSFGDSKTSSSSAAVKEVENKSASTITSESSEQQHHQKILEVSSQTVTHTSGLLSALKVTLRKSCVTRQALRVEIFGGRQSEGRKSSSGKSSVGSSSHPGYGVKKTTLAASQNKDATPDSRNFMRAPQVAKDKVKVSNMSKESIAKIQDLTSKSRWGSTTITAAKSAHQETAKSKVNQVVHSKVMRLHRVNKQDSVAAATKVGVSKYNRLGDGKENAMSQRSNTRAGGMVQVQKATKQIAPQKSGRTRLIAPKGKISCRSEGKSLTNVIQKVHFR